MLKINFTGYLTFISFYIIKHNFSILFRKGILILRFSDIKFYLWRIASNSYLVFRKYQRRLKFPELKFFENFKSTLSRGNYDLRNKPYVPSEEGDFIL